MSTKLLDSWRLRLDSTHSSPVRARVTPGRGSVPESIFTRRDGGLVELDGWMDGVRWCKRGSGVEVVRAMFALIYSRVVV